MNFKNQIKPTLRRLLRDKTYLLVSILSLSAGLLCCLFIFNYVLDELSYDRFHQEADRIYRLELEAVTEDGVATRYARYSVGWMNMFPEVERETQFLRIFSDMIIETNGNHFSENRLITADSTFFQLFSFGLIEGNPQTALLNPNSVVISRSTAAKYFGRTNVTGETLLFRVSGDDREVPLTIKGVVEDPPSNSHIAYDLIGSIDVYKESPGIRNRYSYFKIHGNADVGELEKKISEQFEEQFKKRYPDFAITNRLHLRPMTDIHLHSSALLEFSANSNAAYIYLFAVIGFIILGIACINFAMLAAARSAKRAREAGMRKVFGAGKSSLISATLAESLLLSFAGLILAVLLAWILLPHFNLLSGKHFTFAGLFSPSFLLLMAGVTVVTGTIAGFYPALLLAGNHAKTLLRENMFRGSRRGVLWKGMVIIQIAISIGLISATYIIHSQIDFIFTQDPGFDKEQIIIFQGNFGNQKQTFMDLLRRHPDIHYVTASMGTPGNKTPSSTYVEAEGKTGSLTFDISVVDHYFFDTYGIPVIEGRNFSEELASDSTQASILNETAVETLGWTEPLDKKINIKAWGREGYVIGVVKDFHFASFHNQIAPMVFIYEQNWGEISAKIRSPGNLQEFLSYAEHTWNELLPGIPIRYEFFDERFAMVYETEQRAQSLFFSFSVLAIVIAVLGLFSFTSYMIRQKTREIGIRKVLGATLYDILKLFYTGYAKLLLIAILIAVPAGYLWMTNWLENFAYRTEIGADVLLISFGLVLIVLILSVSFQIVKGALQNPADVIRTE